MADSSFFPEHFKWYLGNIYIIVIRTPACQDHIALVGATLNTDVIAMPYS